MIQNQSQMMNFSKAYNNCVIDFTLNTLDMLNLRSHLTFLSIKTLEFLKLSLRGRGSYHFPLPLTLEPPENDHHLPFSLFPLNKKRNKELKLI